MRLMLADAQIDIPDPPCRVPLPSRLDTASLAWASVVAAGTAAHSAHCPVAIPDPARIAMAYRSDRFFRLDGKTQSAWSPYSRFWRTSDGWIRSHGNYPHHARAFREALDLGKSASPEHIEAIIASMTGREAVARVAHAGGLAVLVNPEDRKTDAALRTTALIDINKISTDSRPQGGAQAEAMSPLRGIRVLDLTRVIAGPVCTRTLALLGADVLRIDPPDLPEIGWQHLDTGHGKRSALLDARDPQMESLLQQADVVILGYRAATMERLGLSPAALARRHPGLVIAQLTAWGTEYPNRVGFDSLVQAESGIAMIESVDGKTPGVLPAQALDHSAGYLLAAGICAVLARRRVEGGTWQVSTSLRRIAAELLGMPRRVAPEAEVAIDPSDHLEDFAVQEHTVTTVRSALPGFSFAAPHLWASDAPRW
ncbi:CoA transferase [Microbacterium sp. A204]|uniref:CoA transferase n=1 Tax=Microbacterium sp. A204 TaxID=3457321 RepID=UPI003FD64D57